MKKKFKASIPAGEKEIRLLINKKKFRQKLDGIKVWLFDWDGVFNPGLKHGDQGSPFSEADSMGVNMLRFSSWLQTGGRMPLMAVVTGAQNETASFFANREKFNFCFRGFKHKIQALEEILKESHLKPEEVGFFFDDILDLSIAKVCGVRICVKNPGLKAFHQYVEDNQYCDCFTGARGGENALREVCDFIIRLQGNYENVLEERTTYGQDYQKFLSEKNGIETSSLRIADP